MAKLDPEFEIESTVDLDNIDEAAAEKLLKRGEKDEIEVVEVADERRLAADLLNFRAETSLEEGLKQTVEWMKKNDLLA